MSNTMIQANSVESDPEDSTGMNYDGPIIRSTVPGLTFPYQHQGVSKMNSFVAKLLDDEGIPNFIWAEPFLSVIGILTAVPFNAFVVADDLIEKAAEALDKARFPQCTQGHDACTVFWHKRDHPYPAYHWHTDLRYPVTAPKMTRGVFLYRKSRLFWKFPDPTLGVPSPNDPYYMLTSDRRILQVRRGPHTGPGSPEDYPVKMPVPARYLEAMMLLELRDTGEAMITAHWEVELDYLWNEIAQKNPNLRVTDLTQPWREWAKRAADFTYPKRTRDGIPAREFQLLLYATLKKEGALPPGVPGNSPQLPLAEMMRDAGVAWP
ncbi:hypothetical protein BJX68DRAFT_265119 [Aspergillus pseudodeflectus]|uniref:Uncharacterized protein n=1 Tax=Aspergillus pseudodeflectus TaxID=176178 RepID=A0ABR4KN19_9EURO